MKCLGHCDSGLASHVKCRRLHRDKNFVTFRNFVTFSQLCDGLRSIRSQTESCDANVLGTTLQPSMSSMSFLFNLMPEENYSGGFLSQTIKTSPRKTQCLKLLKLLKIQAISLNWTTFDNVYLFSEANMFNFLEQSNLFLAQKDLKRSA